MRGFIEDYGQVIRNSRTEILIWAACLFTIVMCITIVVIFELFDIHSILGPPRIKKPSNLSLIVFTPIIENVFMILLVVIFSKLNSINMDKSKTSKFDAMNGAFSTAIIAGILHYSNSPINGVYCFFLFYLMARIFAKNYNAGRGHPAFWVTVTIHAINNAVPRAISMIETLFS